jgi:hypothetical protein
MSLHHIPGTARSRCNRRCRGPKHGCPVHVEVKEGVGVGTRRAAAVFEVERRLSVHEIGARESNEFEEAAGFFGDLLQGAEQETGEDFASRCRTPLMPSPGSVRGTVQMGAVMSLSKFIVRRDRMPPRPQPPRRLPLRQVGQTRARRQPPRRRRAAHRRRRPAAGHRHVVLALLVFSHPARLRQHLRGIV